MAIMVRKRVSAVTGMPTAAGCGGVGESCRKGNYGY